MTDMHSFIDDLLAATPEGERERIRARLRVDVAEDLLLHMQRQGVTKADLAATLGVSRSAVGQALTGSRNMSLNTLADMAQALHLQVRVAFDDLRRAQQAQPAARTSAQPGPIVVRVTGSSAAYQLQHVVRTATGSDAAAACITPAASATTPFVRMQ